MMFSRLSSRYIGLTLFCFSLLGFAFTSPASASVQDLRSAFLGAEAWTDDLSPEQVNAQLKQHFTSVLKTLDQHKASSLLLALRRAEASAPKSWTKAERRQALITLAIRRQQQIDRLRYYAQRGLFPLNEGHAAQAVPIFVDQQNTHCAVGFLMHVDGRDDSITEIVSANNLVQVMEVNQGGLVDWVLTSGLTQEEAALIQPGYPINLDASFADFQDVNFLVNENNLSLSALTYKRVELDIDSSGNLSTLDIVQSAWERGKAELATAAPLSFRGGAGALFGRGTLEIIDNYTIDGVAGSETIASRLDDWLYIGPRDRLFGTLLGGRESTFADGYAQMIEVEYLLQLKNSSFRDYAFSYNRGLDGGSNGVQSGLKVVSEIYDGETDLLIGQLDFFKTDSIFLGNQRSEVIDIVGDFIRVKTYSLTYAENEFANEPEFHSIYYEFGVSTVPEPGTMTGMLLAIGIFAMPGRRAAN